MADRQLNIRGIIYQDGKLLCQQLKPDYRGVERKFWCTPGGGLNENEPLEEGLIREIIEETGITPLVGKLLFVHQFYDGRKENLEFFFHIENPEAFQNIDLSDTTHGQLEINKCEFIDPRETGLLPKFLQTIDIASYVEYSRPVYICADLK